jgi:flagellar biosynthesis anti-sigma factor FlgM
VRIDDRTSAYLNISEVTGPTDGKRRVSAEGPKQTGTEDQVVLSSAAQELAAAQGPEELRQQKIESLKRAVESGTYRVEPEKVADAMLREMSNGRIGEEK